MSIVERTFDVEEGGGFVAVEVSLDPAEGPEPRALVLSVDFRDCDDLPLPPLGERFNFNEKYGWWKYVSSNSSPTRFVLQLEVPQETVRGRVYLHDFKQSAQDLNATMTSVYHTSPPDTNFSGVDAQNPIPVDGFQKTVPVTAGAKVELAWEVARDDERDLILVEFLDSKLSVLLPPEEFPVHPELGTYEYTTRDDSDAPHSIEIQIPKEARFLRLRGKKWSKPGVELLGEPVVRACDTSEGALSQVIDDWISGIGDDDNVFVLYTTAGSFKPSNKLLLRSNRLARFLADMGWKVLLVPFSAMKSDDEVHKIDDNLVQISSAQLQIVIDRLLAADVGRRKIFFCSSRSDIVAVGLQNRLSALGWVTIYEIRDDMEEFRRVGYSKWYRPALEQRFATQADGIVATSPRLKTRIEIISGREDLVLLPNAGPDNLIDETQYMRTTDHFSRMRADRNVIGYLGHMTEAWFDWQKLIELAHALPEVTIEMIGPGAREIGSLPLNIRLLGPMTHEEALPVVDRWKVGLIPFQESRLTYGVDPNKLYEYIAFGIKTVSAPMGSVEGAPGTWVYRTQEELNSAVKVALQENPSADFYEDCEEYLKTANWNYRCNEILSYLEGF